MSGSVALAGLFGLGLGIVTGMPLGVINMAIVQAATARPRFAIGVGIGGALADMTHAALAFLGIAQLIIAQGGLVRMLAAVTTIAIVTYAIVTFRAHRARARASIATEDRGVWRAIPVGLGLTLPNPGSLAAWIGVAALWPAGTPVLAICVAAGVGVGSTAWFVTLAHIVARLGRDSRALQVIPRVAVIAMILMATFGVVRAFQLL